MDAELGNLPSTLGENGPSSYPQTSLESGGSETEQEEEFDSGSDSDDSILKDGSYVRPAIQEGLFEAEKEYKREVKNARVAAMSHVLDPLGNRCPVCTLPTGTCKHNSVWLQHRLDERAKQGRLAAAASSLDATADLQMEDMLDVLAPGGADDLADLFRGSHADGDLSFQSLRWLRPAEQLPDRLNGKAAGLSRPGPLAHHSAVLLGDRFANHRLVVFGGVETPGRELFAPYASVVHPARPVRYSQDVHIFDLVTASWFHPDLSSEARPPARMLHAAAAAGADGRRVLVFGGRGPRGRVLGDTWLLTIEGGSTEGELGPPRVGWREVRPAEFDDPERIYPLDPAQSPDPRFDSAAAPLGDKVFLFGGRDLDHNFGDLWVFSAGGDLCWREPLAVGIPPDPRHGHQLAPLADGRVLVLGGCEAAPLAGGRPPGAEARALALRRAAQRVSNAYAVEDAEIVVGAATMLDPLGEGTSTLDGLGWRGLARATADLAAQVARRERRTGAAEAELRALLVEDRACERWERGRATHRTPYLDVHILDTQDDRYAWSIPRFPAVSGKIPTCRTSFQAVPLAGTKVLVLGGRCPTAEFGQIRHVDFDIHMLDTKTMRWSIPLITNVAEGMQPSINIAATAFRRAQRALEEARAEALAQGALGGNTVQVIEAEAVKLVTQWRLRALIEEQAQVAAAPAPRFGLAAANAGRRVFVYGGFDPGGEVEDLLVLDMEQPHEREARMEEEFHVHLEKERRRREEEARQAALQREYERRRFRQEEERREAENRRLMALEDELSRRPACTRAPPPRRKAANAHTLWLEWDPVRLDARGNPVAPGAIEYILFRKGGWLRLEEGMAVLVAFHPDDAVPELGDLRAALPRSDSIRSLVLSGGAAAVDRPKARLRRDREASKARGSRAASTAASSRTRTPSGSRRLFKASITRVHLDGTFDVVYKDRSKERKVPRERVFPDADLFQWEIVYRGPDTHYEVQSMVPEVNLEREGPVRSSALFCVQTVGADFPEGARSIHSVIVSFETTGNPNNVVISDSSVTKKLKAARAFDSTLSSSAGADQGGAMPAGGRGVTQYRESLGRADHYV